MATRAELERMRIERENRRVGRVFFNAPSTPNYDFDEPPDPVEFGSAETFEEWEARMLLEQLQIQDTQSADVLDKLIANEEKQRKRLENAFDGDDEDDNSSPYPPKLHWIAASVGEILP